MATVSSFPGMRTKNLLSLSQGSKGWGGQVRLARFDRIRSAPRVCLTFFTQSQDNNEDVWGQFVSITPNSSQVDVRSLDGNMKRAEVRKRRDTEVSETEMTVGSADRGEDNPLEYKLPPGDDYSFSDCIISSPESKAASKLSERVSPNLKPYRVRQAGPVVRSRRNSRSRVKNPSKSHVRFFLFCFTTTDIHTHINLNSGFGT